MNKFGGRYVALRRGDRAGATVQAEDAQHRVYPLAVEYVGKVPDFGWLTQLVVRLPDELGGAGDVWLSVSLRGAAVNKALITINAGSLPH